MIHKRIRLDTGIIDVYDHAVPTLAKALMNDIVSKSSYCFGWGDRFDTADNLHTGVDPNQKEIYSIFENVQETPTFKERMQGMNIQKIIINITTSSDVHYSHVHGEKLVALYYINPEWQDHWAGETLFYDAEGEIGFASRYVPGRLILFNGDIPHTIRAQSKAGPNHRFTISYFWDEKKSPTCQRPNQQENVVNYSYSLQDLS